jgi:hypothetical protein
MNKILKYSGLFGLIVFFILAVYLLTQKSCKDNSNKPILDGRIISDSIIETSEIDVKELKIKITNVRNSKYAEITQMPTYEYVKGNKGIYYAIDLKDSATQTIILFPAGEYSFNENEWSVIKSLDNVKSTVWIDILKNVKYKIFIEGQADKTGDKTFNRKFLPKYKYDSVRFHPTIKSILGNTFYYDSATITKILIEPLKNIDLPLLRASYLADKLSSYGDIPKPIVLEGEVKEKVGADYRNGKILLFIDTTKQIK